MAEVQSSARLEDLRSQTIPQPTKPLQIPPPSSATLPPPSGNRLLQQHLGLETFSPVNQNGSYDFDRVLKSGVVQKRTRKTKVDHNVLLLDYELTIFRHGSPYTSFYGLIISRYIRINRRTNCGIRLLSRTSQQSHPSKIRNRRGKICLDYSRPHAITI